MSRKNRNKRRHEQIQSVAAPAPDTSSPPSSIQHNRAIQVQAAADYSKVFPSIPASDGKKLSAATRDGFDNFLSRIGLNNDNSMSASTYVFNMVTRNRVLLEAAYRGSWIVGSMVDSVAEDMTRAGIDITTAKDVDLKKLNKEVTKLQIWESLCAGIKWGRLYGGAISIIQIKGQDLATPLDPETVALGQFEGLSIFDRWMVNPSVTSCIQSGPDMGLPDFYDIVSSPINSQGVGFKAVGSIRVHHSRVIRHIGIELPFFQAITENMWGESNLERLWDRLISFDNATLSAAQLVDRANLRTVGVDGLREILALGGDAQAGLERMFDMMRMLQVNEGLTLIDKEDTFQTTAYTFAGLDAVLLQLGQQLSGAIEVPLIRLFGQLPAGLGGGNGDGDIRMYYDSINAKQNARLRKGWEVLIKVLWHSVFGQSTPDDLEFTFNPLWQMSAMDKATITKTNTESILASADSGLVSRPTALRELKDMSGDTGLFSNITDEEIKEAELEPAPLPDAAPGEEPVEGDLGQSGDKEVSDPVKNLDRKPKWWDFWRSTDSGFKESDHPRKNNGEFGSGGGGTKKKKGSESFEKYVKKSSTGKYEVHTPEYGPSGPTGKTLNRGEFASEEEAHSYLKRILKIKD